MESAKVIIEVVAGVIPEHPEPEYTKRWAITSDEWQSKGMPDALELLAERNGQAQGYAAFLMLSPDRFNWVRVDWLWL